MKKKGLTAKQRAEFKLFDTLQKKHSYTMVEIKSKKDRTAMMFDGKVVSPFVVIRLAVPASSALGEAIKKSRAPQEKR